MADDQVPKLLDQVKFYSNTAKNQIQQVVSPALSNALWAVQVVTGYISNLPEGIREAATAHLNEAQDLISSANSYISYMTAGLMDTIKDLTGSLLSAHMTAVTEASKSAAVDIEKLVERISDKTQGLLSSAVQAVVNNLYNVQDTITSLLAGGYKYITEVFINQLDRIPKAVWDYLDKYLNERVS